MLLWLSTLFANLRRGTAWNGMVSNIKGKGIRWWLTNELAPASYTTPDQKITPKIFLTEAFGWVKHVAIGFSSTLIYTVYFPSRPFDVVVNTPEGGMLGKLFFLMHSPLKVAAMTVASTFVVEVIQFIKAQASFINPVNSLLDIFFYVLGAMLFFVSMGIPWNLFFFL